MEKPLMLVILFNLMTFAFSISELEQWIIDMESYQQAELFYDDNAEPFYYDGYSSRVPSEEFKQYCKRVVLDEKLEQLLLQRYHKQQNALQAIKVYVALGNPSPFFIQPFWDKAVERTSNFERSVVDIAIRYHRDMLRNDLEEFFAGYPKSRQEYNLRYHIVYNMLKGNMDSSLVMYMMKTEPTLLHSVKDPIVLPMLLNKIPNVTNTAHRSSLLRALVKQLNMYPKQYDLIAQSPLANPVDVEEMLFYGFENYKRKGLEEAIVRLSLNFGDSIHLKKADLLFNHLCRYYNPKDLNKREREQLEVLYRHGKGAGIGNYLYKPEVLQSWQEWIRTISPDSEKMRMKLLKHMKKLKLTSTQIYDHLKTSDVMKEDEALIDSLLYSTKDTQFINRILPEAHTLSDSLFYHIFSNATSKHNIEACGGTLVQVLPNFSIKNNVMYMDYILKLADSNKEWALTLKEDMETEAMQREKVPLKKFLYYYYRFCRSNVNEAELIELLNLFRAIPAEPEYKFCIDALLSSFISSISKEHSKQQLALLYDRVLAKTHKRVADRKDLKEVSTHIRNYEPFIFSW